MMYGWSWLWFWWGVSLFILLGVVVFLVVSAGGRRRRVPADPAERMLRRRFASGEISRQEFEERLVELRQH